MKSNEFFNLVESVDDEFSSVDEIPTEWIDTGAYALNAVCSGSLYKGVPANKILCLAGEEGVGKTYFAVSILQNFLKMNPANCVALSDTEGAIRYDEVLEPRGIPPGTTSISRPRTIEAFTTKNSQLIKKFKIINEGKTGSLMVILDSLGNISTIKELEDAVVGSDDKKKGKDDGGFDPTSTKKRTKEQRGNDVRDMTRQQRIRSMFRVLTNEMGKMSVPFIITNHIYTNVGGYGPTEQIAGGFGVKYNSSIILLIKKSIDRGSDKKVKGVLLKAETRKNRFVTHPLTVELQLDHSTGLDRHYGLLPFLEEYKIIEKVSTKWKFPDGSMHFEKHIYDNPEKFFTTDIMSKLETEVNKLRLGSL